MRAEPETVPWVRAALRVLAHHGRAAELLQVIAELLGAGKRRRAGKHVDRLRAADRRPGVYGSVQDCLVRLPSRSYIMSVRCTDSVSTALCVRQRSGPWLSSLKQLSANSRTCLLVRHFDCPSVHRLTCGKKMSSNAAISPDRGWSPALNVTRMLATCMILSSMRALVVQVSP